MKTKKAIGAYRNVDEITVAEGYSIWIENGIWYTAPTVDSKKFGGHAYDNGGYEKGIRDCSCGCSMLRTFPSGPVDPFGACPANPLPDTKIIWKQKADQAIREAFTAVLGEDAFGLGQRQVDDIRAMIQAFVWSEEADQLVQRTAHELITARFKSQDDYV